MFQFARGHILEINTIDGKDFAKVTIAGNVTIDNVLIVYPHNTSSKPLLEDRSTDTNQILLLRSIDGQVYGLPYNIPLQNSTLKAGGYEAGNLGKGNKILFDEGGNIIISNPNGNFITLNEGGKIEIFNASGDIDLLSSSDVSIDGQSIDLGNATAAVLNLLATMTVDTTTSNPTQPVVVVTSGQTTNKVKA